jgi:hypothetical protein
MKNENDILFEAGNYWISREGDMYAVWKNGITHATSAIRFPDLSLAILHAATIAGQRMSARRAVDLANTSR